MSGSISAARPRATPSASRTQSSSNTQKAVEQLRTRYARQLEKLPGLQGIGIDVGGSTPRLVILLTSSGLLPAAKQAFPKELQRELAALGSGVTWQAMDLSKAPPAPTPVFGITLPASKVPAGRPFVATLACGLAKTDVVERTKVTVKGNQVLVDVLSRHKSDGIAIPRAVAVEVKVPALKPGKYTLVAGSQFADAQSIRFEVVGKPRS